MQWRHKSAIIIIQTIELLFQRFSYLLGIEPYILAEVIKDAWTPHLGVLPLQYESYFLVHAKITFYYNINLYILFEAESIDMEQKSATTTI